MDGNTRKPEIQARDVKGLKYFKVLKGLLARLHGVGSGRDKANNRLLHMDQYCTLILLWLYSPIVNSLRGLQQASALKKVQQKFGIRRASLGSLSESVRVFDPEPLKQIARYWPALPVWHGSRSARELPPAAIDCTRSSRFSRDFLIESTSLPPILPGQRMNALSFSEPWNLTACM
jgi:hypothetical protein